MSTVPSDPNSPPTDPSSGWQEQRGLTFSQAEELLDRLEATGIAQRKLSIESDGVCVRWYLDWTYRTPE